MQNTDICTNWIYKPTGEKINWICKLHSVVVIGYNKNKVFVSDSYTGKIESYNRKQLEKYINFMVKERFIILISVKNIKIFKNIREYLFFLFI